MRQLLVCIAKEMVKSLLIRIAGIAVRTKPPLAYAGCLVSGTLHKFTQRLAVFP